MAINFRQRRHLIDNMETPIDIMLLTHNKLENTVRCIDALYSNTPTPFRLNVIDDSDDLTPTFIWRLSAEKENINYIRPRVVIKSANQAINIGLKATTSDPVVFLTNSSFVEPNWLPFALQIMEGDKQVGVVGFKLLFPETNTIIEAGELVLPDGNRPNIGMHEPSHRYTHIREVQAVGWACVLIRRAAIPEEGLAENGYIGFRGMDDTDNCLEIRKRGYKIIYDGFGAVYHRLNSCLGSGTEQGQKDAAANYRHFVEKWAERVP